MLWFDILDTADIPVPIWQLPEPRTPLNIVMGDRGYPDVMDTMFPRLDGIYPF
jgi:hypothetical protein